MNTHDFVYRLAASPKSPHVPPIYMDRCIVVCACTCMYVYVQEFTVQCIHTCTIMCYIACAHDYMYMCISKCKVEWKYRDDIKFRRDKIGMPCIHSTVI